MLTICKSNQKNYIICSRKGGFRMAADERRVTSHIILGDLPESEMVTILVDGKPMQARKGEMILAALLAEGIITVIIISIPAVAKALTQVKRAALQ